MQPDHMEQLLSVKEVARRLSVSTRSVWRYTAMRRLPQPIRLAGSVRWRAREIQEYIDTLPPVPQRNGAR